MEDVATTDAVKNIDNGDCDAVAVAVHNASRLQVLLPPLFLPVGVPYVISHPPTIASTVHVATIVGG